MIANFFFGIGSMLIFGMITTMLTEFMPKRSSSGVALNNFMRNIFSCVGIIVTSPILHGIGNGWFFTILGLVGVVSGVVVIITMRRMGPKWRESMDALKN
jgi:MFS family permease